MTRSEAKEDVLKCDNRDWARGYNMAIDIVYDDFENRTCSNCKHCEPIKDGYHCLLNIKQKGYEVELNFGCNKWELKDDR